jgi:hypothetical protein
MQPSEAVKGETMEGLRVTTRGYIVGITIALAIVGFAGWVEGL